MSTSASKLPVHPVAPSPDTLSFCKDFVSGGALPKYILGRNDIAKNIASAINVDGFIDDFTTETEYLGKKIVPMDKLPKTALVVSTAAVRPLSAMRRMRQTGLRHLDYFALTRHADIQLGEVAFWDNHFPSTFETTRPRYESLYAALDDEASRTLLEKIVNFRLSGDLSFYEGFSDKQDVQYFESFLNFSDTDDVFLDVGCFDGATTELFIDHCPNYKGIHIFEPSPANMRSVKSHLSSFERVTYWPFGLSDKNETLRFQSDGSSSRISKTGDIRIDVKRLDDVLDSPFTFLKMDIEGAESYALEGAKESILAHHPKLAISAYHRPNDLFELFEQVMAYRSDYRVFLRHYPEGVTEPVLFFIPS